MQTEVEIQRNNEALWSSTESNISMLVLSSYQIL